MEKIGKTNFSKKIYIKSNLFNNMGFEKIKPKVYSAIILALFFVLLGCVEQGPATPAKLVSAKQGKIPNDYDDLYEGDLIFDIAGKEVKMHLCTTNWGVVEEGTCYALTEENISENMSEYIYSSRLSGCYFGTLPKTPCEQDSD